MDIFYTGKIIQSSGNRYIDTKYPVGSEITVDSYWFDRGWMPILNIVIDSSVLDLSGIEWNTKVNVFI